MKSTPNLLQLALVLLLGCGDESPQPALCDAASVTSALSTAVPGDRVSLGGCRIEGDFLVPAGVTLSGVGPSSVLAGQDVTVRVETTDQLTLIETLAIEAGARGGVVLRGSGRARISAVEIAASTGVALGAEGLAELELSEVAVQGPVDASNQGQIAYPPDRNQTATHGIAAVRIASLTLTDVSARGFAGTGVLAIDSALVWERGDADQNLGLGLHVQGGRAELHGVGLDQTFRGTWGIETYGGAFTASAAVTSTDLTADDNWYGLLHHGGTAQHLNLSAQRNQNAAVWTQFSSGFELTGTIADNDFAGVVAYRASNVYIHDSSVETTHEVLRPNGEVGTVMVGDGIQLVESTDGARLTNLDLIDNERVGLLIELRGGNFAAMELDDVRIQQSSGNGCVLQHGTAPSDWDRGVLRSGVTQAADRAVTDLDFADVVGPCGRPNELTGLGALGL